METIIVDRKKNYKMTRNRKEGTAGKLHRKIMEQHLRRKLESWEIVHHKDGDIWNNNIDNLELTTQPIHSKYLHPNISWTFEGRVKGGEARGKYERDFVMAKYTEGLLWCHTCKQYLPIDRFGMNLRRFNGYCFECKTCHNKRRRDYYDKRV